MVATASDLRPRTHAGIRTVAEVHAAASAFKRISRPASAEHGRGGRVAFLSIGPGQVRLGTRTFDSLEPLIGMTREQWLHENGPMVDPEGDDEVARRGKITGWSQKSRNRMRQTLGLLDYSPMFGPGRQLPKMITLTMPARWETVAPSAEVFKNRLVRDGLKRMFRRHWGYDFVGVWKLEFQRRGAPHLHILASPPAHERKTPLAPEPVTFETWLRLMWSKVCADEATTFEELQNHRAKGVHVEDTYGLTGTDAKRIADYFVKHGIFAAKEYQNQAPDLWVDENGESSPGRFWGYWGLRKAEGEAVLGFVDDGPKPAGGGHWRGPFPDESSDNPRRSIMSTHVDDDRWVDGDDGEVPAEVAAARILRRWAKANGKHRKVRVTLSDVDPLTGEVVSRRSSRWHGPFVRRGAGFVSVNDGVGFAEQLLAALEGRPRGAPPDGRHGARFVDDEVARRLAEREELLRAYQAVIDDLAA